MVADNGAQSRLHYRKDFKPELRDLLAGDLTTTMVDQFYEHLRTDGRIEGKPLASGHSLQFDQSQISGGHRGNRCIASEEFGQLRCRLRSGEVKTLGCLAFQAF